ncbi:unnamed protein product [Haemonchus placei]|uniref:Uncharacterized protein n=1 Tax=Haemonchus placei TaxID=6290 RepID=A0A3P7SPI5_HAEPC|nr:unnamed protein product [Haemonchus placei]
MIPHQKLQLLQILHQRPLLLSLPEPPRRFLHRFPHRSIPRFPQRPSRHWPQLQLLSQPVSLE